MSHDRLTFDDGAWAPAHQLAEAVANRRVSALAVTEAALARIAARNGTVNAFTDVLETRARETARGVDAALSRGEAVGPLAGVPFAVKNLFDVRGLATRAGSKINRDRAPADRDAALIVRMEAQGAVLTGALNMGEYAYDFTGENIHDGHSRNPHDLTRMAGGSSGGSAAAVAGGLVPLALGSDTNGSIRLPASFCGLFGLKPTYGRLSRARTYPFVGSLDHLGPLARTVEDLALSYDAMQGADADDPVCTGRVDPAFAALGQGVEGLRLAVAGGYFQEHLMPEARAALDAVTGALGITETVDLPEARRARAAAFLISTAEGASLHLDRMRARPGDFDPAVRDRLFAGAMVPAALMDRAQKFRRWYRARVLEVFETTDVIIAPATPCVAPELGKTTFMLGGAELNVRAHIGIFTQPISFIGLPVVAVPVPVGPLPIGVQVIAAPWREDLALRVAHHLQQAGTVQAVQPPYPLKGAA
ncbi:AtzE family amidohydrolase [Arenibacterium halophilum]|uniref:AtzE family amidohydrolase n=2 Tax=Arenibacterium halophilum TaxID=2583821 RepID=A0ABY2WZK2_9RHOB|nr:AtzE family amidohydrolase [Arenibacterium halophilum]